MNETIRTTGVIRMKQTALFFLALLFAGCLSVWGQGEANNAPPIIEHDPVSVAVQGQPITILAKVSDDAGSVKSVVLYYTPSKDAAPFKIPMHASGAHVYYGTIPTDLIGESDRISYYIEAIDNMETMAETSWYNVEIRNPSAADTTPKRATPTAGSASEPVQTVAPSTPARQEGEKANLVGIGIIAGGAVAVAGGALLASNMGDDGGDDSSSDNGGGTTTVTNAGTYKGTATVCFEFTGASPSCSSHAVTILVDNNNLVSSSTLQEGVALTDTLSGNSFMMTAPVEDTDTGLTGEIIFTGTLIDERIVGSVAGSATSTTGSGVYSGTFSATKQ